MIIINLTVWETVEALREYVYKSAHSQVLRDRRRWFEKFGGPYYSLWWIPAGHSPTPEEGKERLDYMRKYGDSAHAFSFKSVFNPPAIDVVSDG